MPAVTFMPDTWTIANRQTGGRYNISRMIETQFFDAGKDAGEADAKVRKHVETFLTMLTKDRTMFFEDASGRNLVFNFEYSQVRYENIPGSLRGFKVRGGMIPLILQSRDWRPTQATKPTRIVKATDNDIYNAIFQELLKNRKGNLSAVREFRRNTEMPKGSGLTVGMQFSQLNPEKHGAGVDLFDFAAEINVYNKQLPDNKAILKNADIAENIKEIFERDETFKGVLWNSEIQSIEFGTVTQEKASFYASQVTLLCRKHKSTKQFTKVGA